MHSHEHFSIKKPTLLKENCAHTFYYLQMIGEAYFLKRNEDGGVLLSSGSDIFYYSSTEEVELQACREGLQLAVQWLTPLLIP
jgi:hypothetical protein